MSYPTDVMLLDAVPASSSPEEASGFALDFANGWIAAWNAHDLEAIISHYAPEIVFLSPVAERRFGNGRVEGIAALRDYWGLSLKSQPELRFEFRAVLSGFDALTILYRNHRAQLVAETVEFNSGGKVVRSYACYSD